MGPDQLSFTGSYDEQDAGYPQVKKGRTPQRTIERQVHAGFWVVGDGAVPLRGQGFDGNAEDRQAVEPALERLDAIRAGLCKGGSPLVVGDSKLLSAANVRAFYERRLRFLCPHPKDAALATRLAALEEETLRPLAYAAERHREGPPRYRAKEGRVPVAGKELRALFVLSLDDQAAAREQRAKQLARAEQEIAQLNRGVPRYTKDAAALERKARGKLERRGVASLLQLAIVEEVEERPQARLARDEQAIVEAMRLDGRYCLVTNDEMLPADELFAAYKRQHLIESRFRDFKGPLAVRPVFLHSNRRIAALLAVVSLAILLYALIEREVRRGLAALGPGDRRLVAQRIGRATGRKIFDQLSDLATVRIRDGPTRLAQPRPVQQLLLKLLGL